MNSQSTIKRYFLWAIFGCLFSINILAKCQDCGAENHKGAKNCIRCNALLESNSPEEPPATDNAQTPTASQHNSRANSPDRSATPPVKSKRFDENSDRYLLTLYSGEYPLPSPSENEPGSWGGSLSSLPVRGDSVNGASAFLTPASPVSGNSLGFTQQLAAAFLQLDLEGTISSSGSREVRRPQAKAEPDLSIKRYDISIIDTETILTSFIYQIVMPLTEQLSTEISDDQLSENGFVNLTEQMIHRERSDRGLAKLVMDLVEHYLKEGHMLIFCSLVQEENGSISTSIISVTYRKDYDRYVYRICRIYSDNEDEWVDQETVEQNLFSEIREALRRGANANFFLHGTEPENP